MALPCLRTSDPREARGGGATARQDADVLLRHVRRHGREAEVESEEVTNLELVIETLTDLESAPRTTLADRAVRIIETLGLDADARATEAA